MFLEPWNWERLDFKVTLALDGELYSVEDRVVADRSSNIGRIEMGSRIYTGSGDRVYVVIDETSVPYYYRITEFPDDLEDKQIIRMDLRVAGNESNPFLTFNLTKPAPVGIAVDPANTDLIGLLGDEWANYEETITAKRRDEPDETRIFNLYWKDYEAGPVELPGNGNVNTMMYFVIADAGEPLVYPVGLDVFVTAHTTLMEDNSADAAFYSPSLKAEGGIVCTGIEPEGAEIRGEPVDLTHIDFVENCDANMFINTEGGDYGLQTAVDAVTDIQFVDHIIKNNGFRLIDTYNDLAPAFGGDSQVLQVENMLGYPMGDYSMRVPLDENVLISFANMNLLNSPNLIGVYLKSIVTDTGVQVWRDEDTHKGLNYTAVRDYIRDNAVSYRYFLSMTGTGNEISLIDLLKRIGNRNEGEQTFRILAGFEDGTSFEISAGAFIQDYFTNVYDPVIGGIQPVSVQVFTGEVKE